MSTPIHSKSESGCTLSGDVSIVGIRYSYYEHTPSHIQTVLSRLQLASKVPVLEYATLLHSVSWPSNKLAHSHSPGLPLSSNSCSHIPMLESNEAVAKVRPEGDHATDLTVLRCPVGMLAASVKFKVPSPSWL